jgi:hypothetical protein
MKLQERVAQVEVMVGNLAAAQKETRDELRSFRHDLFALLTPLIQKTSSLEAEVKWIEKTRRWTPFLKIGSATGLAGAVIEAMRAILNGYK